MKWIFTNEKLEVFLWCLQSHLLNPQCLWSICNPILPKFSNTPTKEFMNIQPKNPQTPNSSLNPHIDSIVKYLFINTTLVNFKSYSTLSTSIPQKAILMMKDTNVTMFSPLTLFNILNNTFLNIDTVIYKNNIMSQNEKLILLNSDTCIFIDRSSVTFDNLVFKSSLSSINKAVYYIKPVYLQTKTLTITNVDFLVSNFFWNIRFRR